MNKKEIAEIKKLYTKDKHCLDRIAGCYVNGDKEKVMTFKEAFLSLQEEPLTQYLEMFRKSLSGSMGRNLCNLAFPLEAEAESGPQALLMKLRGSDLKDDALLNEFYDTIIEKWYHPENYLILLVNGVYDVPGKTTDGVEMEDASTDVFHYIHCLLCPIALSKGSLCYNPASNQIEEALRNLVVGMPQEGFLFPSFNDRGSDIHNILYYSGDTKEYSSDLMEQVLGCGVPLTAGAQKESFQAVLSESLGSDCSFDVVRQINENLNDMIEVHKDNPEPLTLGRAEMKTLMERSGATPEAVKHMEERFTEDFGPQEVIMASNVAAVKTFEVKAPEISVKVTPDYADMIEIQEIAGARCLVIPLAGEVEVNGITVSLGQTMAEDDLA